MSEFMISDAALATRMQEMQEQSTDFAELLNGFDNAEKSETVKPGEINQPQQTKQEQVEQPDSKLPEESTKVKPDEAPNDKYVESEDTEDKTDIKNVTAEQMTFAALQTVEIDSEISAEFEEITASLTENAETVEITPTAPIDGEIDITSPVQQQVVPEGILNPETAGSGIEASQQTTEMEQSSEFAIPELTEIFKSVDDAESAEKPTDMLFAQNPDDTAAEVAVLETVTADKEIMREAEVRQDMPEKADNVGFEESTEDIPIKTTGSDDYKVAETPAEITSEVAETLTAGQNTKSAVEVRSESGQVKAEQISKEGAVSVEANNFVRSASKAQTEGEGSGTDTSGSQKGFEAFENAAEKGEISAPEVRTVTREVPVKAEQPEERTEVAQPVRIEQSGERFRTQNERREAGTKITSVTEELEMLKNAKTKSVQTSEKPFIPLENPLNTDSPILITRANGESVEVRPSEIIEQAAAKLVETAQTMKEQATEYSLVLNPEELGRIVVKLVKAADGAVSVSISADNSRTQRILEQHSAAMQENLRDNGIKLEGWQMVRESEQETYAQDYNGSSKNPYYREENHSHSEQEGEETNFADLIASM